MNGSRSWRTVGQCPSNTCTVRPERPLGARDDLTPFATGKLTTSNALEELYSDKCMRPRRHLAVVSRKSFVSTWVTYACGATIPERAPLRILSYRTVR